jgi:elongation factor 1-alpha
VPHHRHQLEGALTGGLALLSAADCCLQGWGCAPAGLLLPWLTPPCPALPLPQVGKETGGKKLESPHSLKANEMAEVVFEPCQPLVVDSFKNCEGLSRIAFLDGNTAVMLGKVVKTTSK